MPARQLSAPLSASLPRQSRQTRRHLSSSRFLQVRVQVERERGCIVRDIFSSSIALYCLCLVARPCSVHCTPVFQDVDAKHAGALLSIFANFVTVDAVAADGAFQAGAVSIAMRALSKFASSEDVSKRVPILLLNMLDKVPGVASQVVRQRVRGAAPDNSAIALIVASLDQHPHNTDVQWRVAYLLERLCEKVRGDAGLLKQLGNVPTFMPGLLGLLRRLHSNANDWRMKEKGLVEAAFNAAGVLRRVLPVSAPPAALAQDLSTAADRLLDMPCFRSLDAAAARASNPLEGMRTEARKKLAVPAPGYTPRKS
jgi:hypothetical protein